MRGYLSADKANISELGFFLFLKPSGFPQSLIQKILYLAILFHNAIKTAFLPTLSLYQNVHSSRKQTVLDAFHPRKGCFRGGICVFLENHLDTLFKSSKWFSK